MDRYTFCYAPSCAFSSARCETRVLLTASANDATLSLEQNLGGFSPWREQCPDVAQDTSPLIGP